MTENRTGLDQVNSNQLDSIRRRHRSPLLMDCRSTAIEKDFGRWIEVESFGHARENDGVFINESRRWTEPYQMKRKSLSR